MAGGLSVVSAIVMHLRVTGPIARDGNIIGKCGPPISALYGSFLFRQHQGQTGVCFRLFPYTLFETAGALLPDSVLSGG